jgi:hypothetical protein
LDLRQKEGSSLGVGRGVDGFDSLSEGSVAIKEVSTAAFKLKEIQRASALIKEGSKGRRRQSKKDPTSVVDQRRL